jgi:hypothetical protein
MPKPLTEKGIIRKSRDGRYCRIVAFDKVRVMFIRSASIFYSLPRLIQPMLRHVVYVAMIRSTSISMLDHSTSVMLAEGGKN